MASKSLDTRIKHFFAVFIAIFLFAGLGIFVIASQNKTNTESDAYVAYGCNNKPDLSLISQKSYQNTNEFVVRLKSADKHSPRGVKCPSNRYNLRINSPDGWKVSFLSENSGTSSIINLDEGESNEIIITVTPRGAKKGTVQLTAVNTNPKDTTPQAYLDLVYKTTENNPAKNNPNKPKQGKCTKDPDWILKGTTDGSNYVIYHLKLIDNCPGEENDYKIGISDMPSNSASWSWKFEHGGYGKSIIKKNVGKSGATTNLTISRSTNQRLIPKKGRYVFTLKADGINNNTVGLINLNYFVDPK